MKPHSVWGYVCVIVLLLVTIAYAVDERRLESGQTRCFDANGTNPHDITNANPFDVFIPNNTAAEWDAFLGHLPANVTKNSVASCAGCALGNVTINAFQSVVMFATVTIQVMYTRLTPYGTGVRAYCRDLSTGTVISWPPNSLAGGSLTDTLGVAMIKMTSSAGGHDCWFVQYNSTCEGNPTGTYHMAY